MLNLFPTKTAKNKKTIVKVLVSTLVFFALNFPAYSFADSGVQLSVEVKPAPTINDFNYSFNNDASSNVKGAETTAIPSYKNYIKTMNYLSVVFPPLGILNFLT